MFETEENHNANLPPEALSTVQVGTTGAFLGKSGKLYVRIRRLQPTPSGENFHDQTAVYPNVEAYNERSAKPEYTTLGEIQHDFLKPIEIDPATLTIGESPIRREGFTTR